MFLLRLAKLISTVFQRALTKQVHDLASGIDDPFQGSGTIYKSQPLEPVQITMRRDYDVTIREERFSLSGTTEVPEYAAVFLIGRKEASIGDGTAPRDGFF